MASIRSNTPAAAHVGEVAGERQHQDAEGERGDPAQREGELARVDADEPAQRREDVAGEDGGVAIEAAVERADRRGEDGDDHHPEQAAGEQPHGGDGVGGLGGDLHVRRQHLLLEQQPGGDGGDEEDGHADGGEDRAEQGGLAGLAAVLDAKNSARPRTACCSRPRSSPRSRRPRARCSRPRGNRPCPGLTRANSADRPWSVIAWKMPPLAVSLATARTATSRVMGISTSDWRKSLEVMAQLPPTAERSMTTPPVIQMTAWMSNPKMAAPNRPQPIELHGGVEQARQDADPGVGLLGGGAEAHVDHLGRGDGPQLAEPGGQERVVGEEPPARWRRR